MVTLTVLNLELSLVDAEQLHTLLCSIQLALEAELRRPGPKAYGLQALLRRRSAMYGRIAVVLAQGLLQSGPESGPPPIAEAALGPDEIKPLGTPGKTKLGTPGKTKLGNPSKIKECPGR
jgi:hypothetical protein